MASNSTNVLFIYLLYILILAGSEDRAKVIKLQMNRFKYKVYQYMFKDKLTHTPSIRKASKFCELQLLTAKAQSTEG